MNNPKYDHGRMLELYRQGMNDREISRDIGCDPTTVQKWRRMNGLTAQRPKVTQPMTPPVRGRKKPAPPAETPCGYLCSSCRWRGTFATARRSYTCCDFASITGRSRFSLPAREDGRCPAYERGDQQSRRIPRWA